MPCPVCKASEIVRISVAVGRDQMTLHSCSNCDARWWDDASGNRMSLQRVLALAGQGGRRRRTS